MENKNLYKGIFCIVFSAFCFSLMGMLVHLAGGLPFMQKAFFRNIVSLFIALALLVRDKNGINIPEGSFKFLLLRAAAGSAGVFGNFYALDHIPIADAGILNKMSPFFAVVFSMILLHESVRIVPFLCILGAFLGAVLVIKPSAGIVNSFPAVIAFFGGMGAGLAYACVRKLGSMKMTGAVIVVFFSFFSCVISVPFMIREFVPMSPSQLLILIGTGIAASGGQFGITYAYYYAPARDISVYDYSQVIFSAVLGYAVFSQVPDFFSLAGYTVIVCMAVIVFIYNRKGIRTKAV